MSDKIEMFKMTSYDPVLMMAGFSYISESNQVKTISISQMIFRELMGDKPWDQKKYGQILAPQFEFRSCLRNHGKDIPDWNKWFDDMSNKIVMDSAASRNSKGI